LKTEDPLSAGSNIHHIASINKNHGNRITGFISKPDALNPLSIKASTQNVCSEIPVVGIRTAKNPTRKLPKIEVSIRIQ
jgi:hypothetical protein